MVVGLSLFLRRDAGEVGGILELDAWGEKEGGLVENSVFVAPLADGLGEDGEEAWFLWMKRKNKKTESV